MRWELPQCKECKLYPCCKGLDELRTAIVVKGRIVGYEDDCHAYQSKEAVA